MKVNFENSIDISIFAMMQVSKKCLEMGLNRPPMFISNPGIGKSTAVQLWAEVNEYDLILLRISNETPDTLTGYDIADGAAGAKGAATSATHIRPSWFQKILDNHAKGVKSVLFLDEITTSDPYTQGAALNLVFDRRCHAEYLPKDTLICAAGNYAQNLSSEMTVLAPMLNRFIIFNIIPGKSDLEHFLCKYNGAAAGDTMDFLGEIRKAMEKLRDQERKDLGSSEINKVGEILEAVVRNEAFAQMNDGTLDTTVTELKDIYSDNDGDSPVANYFTFRSANYLRDVAVATYICFGKAGLLSENFEKMIHGTVGLSISRKRGKNGGGEVQKTLTTARYSKAFKEAANDIERLFDKRLPEYHRFFNEVLEKSKKAKSVDVPDIGLVRRKIQEMCSDPKIKSIDRPLDPGYLEELYSLLKSTMKKNSFGIEINFDDRDAVAKILSDHPEQLVGYINTWNEIAALTGEIYSSLLSDKSRNYSNTAIASWKAYCDVCRKNVSQFKVFKKVLAGQNPSIASTIPNIAPVCGDGERDRDKIA